MGFQVVEGGERGEGGEAGVQRGYELGVRRGIRVGGRRGVASLDSQEAVRAVAASARKKTVAIVAEQTLEVSKLFGDGARGGGGVGGG